MGERLTFLEYRNVFRVRLTLLFAIEITSMLSREHKHIEQQLGSAYFQ